MSTLAELLDECEDRIPESKLPRLFPLVNRVLQTMAKRLRMLDSDLVRGELDVSLWATREYAGAGTVAFVSGYETTAPTITDSASNFVSTGDWGEGGWGATPYGEDDTSSPSFYADMFITTDGTGNPGPFLITTAIDSTLTLAATDVVVDNPAGPTVTITTVDQYGPLPSDFWGLIDRPHIDGYTWKLLPIPDEDTKLLYTSAGLSRYFQIIGTDKLWVWPPTSDDMTIKGPYFKRPAKITDMETVLPWNELLDDVLVEFLAMWVRGEASENIAKYVMTQTDLIILGHGHKAPKAMNAGVDWNCLVGGDI